MDMGEPEPISDTQYSNFDYNGNGIFNFGGLSLGKGRQSTETISIDSLNLTGCDFMKIDVEGFEYAVVLGAIKTIMKYKPVIFYECNSRIMKPEMCLMAELPYRDAQVYNVQKLLTCIGYNAFTEIGDNIIAEIKD